jgi:Bax protein
MLNLNRHRAYKEFRELRYLYYQNNKKFRGIEAATTMHNYSAIGEEYNKILKSIIKSNKWER